MSSDPENEYFSDGITEEIINALAKIKNLNVTSRTSSFYYKGKNIPIRKIGEELNVGTILEGSVRRSGDTLRITAQLINTKDDFHFWSESWDRIFENIFEIQDEISLIIAEKLRENMGHFEIHENLVAKQTDNLEAYELFLKARFHFQKWNPSDIQVAMSMFEKAIELDPHHAESYIALSQCYSFLGGLGILLKKESLERSNELANKALELNSDSPDVYFALAGNRFWNSWNFQESFRLTLKTLEIRPSYALGHQFAAMLYALLDQRSKAMEHIQIAQRLDPLSQELFFTTAFMYYIRGDFEKALQLLDRCIEDNPTNVLAHTIKCVSLLQQERFDEVLSYFDFLPDEGVVLADKTGLSGLAYIMKGDMSDANRCRQALMEQSACEESGFRAEAYVFLMDVLEGKKDKAFKWIEQGLKKGISLPVILLKDPLTKSLREDPRYLKLHKQIFESDVFNEVTRKKRLLDTETTQKYTSYLQQFMEESRPYLDANLSLRSLADQIGVNPNQLSWLINEKYGKNFNELVNEYRVEAFKELAVDPKNAHLTLIGLAYESGFNSKTVFNTFFKKSTGLTPNQYLKQARLSVEK